MASAPTVADRIGGRWAISLRAWVALTILTSFALPLSIPAAEGPRGRVIALLSGVIVAVVLGAAMLIADRTVFRHRRERPVPLRTVIVVDALFGLVHSVTSASMLLLLGLPDSAAVPEGRILFSVSMAPVVLIALSLIFDDIERYGREREALLERLLTLRAQTEDRTELTESIEAAVQAEIRVSTDPILADLNATAANLTPAERLAMAERLQAVAMGELRPLSQRLHDARVTPTRDPYVRQAVWTIFRNQRVEPALASLVSGSFFFLFNTVRYDLRLGIAQFVVQAGLTYAVLRPLASLDERRRRSGGGFPALVVGAGLVALLTAGKGLIVQLRIVDEPDIPSTALASLWAPVVVIAVSFTASALRMRRDGLDDLVFEVDERTLDAIIANRELVRVSRDLAQHVHGTLQSTLLATAFAIESATRTNDTAAFERAVEEARIALQTAPQLESVETDLRAEVERRLALWEGFLAIEATVLVDDPLPPAAIRDIGRALEEGISNAHKHGRATRIDVTVAPEAGGIRLDVADDGRGPLSGVPGMGSRVLDEIAPGGWSVRPGPQGGAVLTVRLARAEPRATA